MCSSCTARPTRDRASHPHPRHRQRPAANGEDEPRAHDRPRDPLPAVCRDEIKEGMVHAAGETFRAATGDPLTQRTHPVFFDVLGTLLAAGVTTVAEAAFQDPLWRHGLEPLLGHARLRIVQCHTDPAIGRERRRLAAERGQTAHAKIVGDEIEDWREAYASFERLSIPAPSIDVDTTEGYVPGIEAIVELVRRR